MLGAVLDLKRWTSHSDAKRGKKPAACAKRYKKKMRTAVTKCGKDTFGGGELKEFGYWCLECVKRYLIGDLESMQNGKLSLRALRVRHFK